jgi:hypothetical protein
VACFHPPLFSRHFFPGAAALLLVMSYYIPTTYSHTLTWEINAGRTEAATLRLVTGV